MGLDKNKGLTEEIKHMSDSKRQFRIRILNDNFNFSSYGLVFVIN